VIVAPAIIPALERNQKRSQLGKITRREERERAHKAIVKTEGKRSIPDCCRKGTGRTSLAWKETSRLRRGEKNVQ